MKQTAVEWLYEAINNELIDFLESRIDVNELSVVMINFKHQALEMEKQQTIKIIEMARDSSICECALGTHIEYEYSENSIIEQLKQPKQ